MARDAADEDDGRPRNPGRRRFLAGLAAAGLLGLGVDARFLEPDWLDVTRHEVALPGLPAKLDGLKVAQLSDLHRSGDVSEEQIAAAVAAANALRPDLVVLTGDFVTHSPDFAPSCARILAGLRPRLGVYAIPGNHDNWVGAGRVLGALGRQGIEDLTNRNTHPAPGLRLAGIDDVWTGRPDLGQALRGHTPDEALIVLSHSPNVLPQVADRGVPALCLAGHTHGGQICLPPIPRNWLPGVSGSPYVSGWYSLQSARLYVNRGIGTVFIPVRLFCRPEVTLFTLRASPLP